MQKEECRVIQELLPAFKEGVLAHVQTEEVRRHLSACRSCAQEADRLERSWDLLDQWDAPQVPVNFSRLVLDRLHQERKNVWLRRALPAAALFLLMLGVVWFSVMRNQEKAVEVAAPGIQPHQSLMVSQQPISEDEIIGSLELLEEKEFYDRMEDLKLIDYLPLVDEKSPKKDDNRSSSMEWDNS